MDFKYTLVYLNVNIFCLIVAAIIVSKFSLNVGSERDIIIFRKMVTCYAVFLFTEITWALGNGFLPINPVVNELIKVFGTFFIPLMVYYWFTFALNRFHIEIKNKFIKALTLAPIIILLILYATSSFTGIIYQFDASGNVVYGPGYAAGGLVDNIYGILVVINAVVLLFRNKDQTDRFAYFNHIVFIVICTFGGILDAIVTDAPIMQLAICLSFIFLFIQIQEPHIFNDSLTRLNNRRRTEIFMNDIFEKENENWHLFMIDVDNFKQINDTKGHMFGDSILKLVANSLMDVADEYPKAFVSRWGGDEFVFLIQNKNKDFTEELSDKIHAQISKNAKKENIDYPIHLSLGHAQYNKENTNNINDFVEAADKELYIAKRNNKSS